MVFTRKRRSQQKRQLTQLNGSLNDIVIGSNTKVGVIEKQTLESQTHLHYNKWERIADGDISTHQNQVIGNNIDDRIRKAVDSTVKTVANRMHDVALTAMDNVVISRVEKAVRAISASPGHGPTSTFENPDRRDFVGNT